MTWSCRLHPVTVGAKRSFDLSQNAASQFYGEAVSVLARRKRERDMAAIVLLLVVTIYHSASFDALTFRIRLGAGPVR